VIFNVFTINKVAKVINMKTTRLKKILTHLFGIFMVFGGVAHFISPEVYYPFFPEDFIKDEIIYASGLLEIIIGCGVFVPSLKIYAVKAILILMIIFLPLHIIDIFKENPAIGSRILAYIRLPLQFVLIYWAFFIQENKRLNFKR
jgi:uncharacterized membrane protein